MVNEHYYTVITVPKKMFKTFLEGKKVLKMSDSEKQ